MANTPSTDSQHMPMKDTMAIADTAISSKSMLVDSVISFSEAIIAQADFETIEAYYTSDLVNAIVRQVLTHLEQAKTPLTEPFASHLFNKPSSIEIYVTDVDEGREINLEARGKDYATNILSYPSELPPSVIELLSALPLGELVICHAVVVKQAQEQGKTFANHLTHLLVHGVLHLLGFDHELGPQQQDEMEAIEIAVLANCHIANPYE